MDAFPNILQKKFTNKMKVNFKTIQYIPKCATEFYSFKMKQNTKYTMVKNKKGAGLQKWISRIRASTKFQRKTFRQTNWPINTVPVEFC